MKEFSKKFLNKKIGEATSKSINDNAIKANKNLGIPTKIWIQYSNLIDRSELFESIKQSNFCMENTLFMAGFACGWAENNKKVK